LNKKTFKDLEHEGWTARAASYELITPVTNQAIAPILATFGELKSQRLLEIACGPGHLAARAASLGANIEAIDFADTMIELAQARYPTVLFRQGDAEQLTDADGQFDGVICAFGLLHLEHPERAIGEAFRVLKPGGRYTYSVWCPPEQGGDFFGFLMGAIQEHGNLNIELPAAPPFYRFADAKQAESALRAAGFAAPLLSTAPIVWRGESPRDAVDLIYKATVRTKLLLDGQTDDAREAIHQGIMSGIEKFRVDEHFEIALPALLVSALKPD
jgi:SAM-dependent methyltransferase